MNEGLAAMVGRDPGQARQAFLEVAKAGANGFAKEDVDLAKFFGATANTLADAAAIPANATLRADNHEAFALFLFALKDIAQLDANDAVALLERFLAAQPAGKVSWMADYKPLAQKYLHDARIFAEWKHSLGGNGSAADLRRKLKMKSAISDALSSAS